MEEKQYRVTWEIDIWAESPRAAAEEALDIQRDRGGVATVFEVKEFDSEEDAVMIDAADEEGEA